MKEGEPKFEVGISRHAPKPKKETMVGHDIRTEEIDPAKAAETVGPKVNELLARLEAANDGTIMALEPSNLIRAKQTRDLLIKKLSEILQGRADIKLVSLGENEEGAASMLEQIRISPGMKYIIADLRGTWLLGSKETEPMVDAANKWDKRFGGDENLRGAFWASHKDELPRLHQKLQQAGIDITLEELRPADFQHTPEEAALRQIKWMLAMRKMGQKHLPGRPIILEGISHNIRSDFASLALLGEDISLESVERVLGSKFREPFARSSVVFSADGSVEVSDRGIIKNYTPEEFEGLLKGIREKAKARKQEWGLEE